MSEWVNDHLGRVLVADGLAPLESAELLDVGTPEDDHDDRRRYLAVSEVRQEEPARAPVEDVVATVEAEREDDALEYM